MIVTLSDYQTEGPQGPQGPQGETGPAGAVGPAGPSGADGADGAAAPDPVVNFAALPLASANTDAVILVQDPRITYRSDGVNWIPLNNIAMLKAASDAPSVIQANTGLTWTATDNGSGKVRLTSNAAHGLTASPAVGASLYSTTTQNNWIADSFHEISAIISTTQIDLTTDFSSHGVPVFALAGTEVTVATVAIPPLSPNGGIEIDHTWVYEPASTNSKRIVVSYGGTKFLNSNQSNGSNEMQHVHTVIQNTDSTSSQTTGFSLGNGTGFGSTSALPVSGSIDSSVSQDLTLSVIPAVANEVIKSTSYRIKLFA